MSVVVGASIVGVLLLAALAVLVWGLVSSTKVRGVDPDWLKRFSVASYRPMERLLSEDDIRFLRSQPGYVPGMEKVFRARRRKIFRLYLAKLRRDFGRLHLALRLMVLHAPQDNPELAKTLVKQKFVFLAGLLAVHVRLSLYALGLGWGGVDASGLVRILDTMRAELQNLMLAPAPVAAS